TANQSAAAAPSAGGTTPAVNSLRQLYPIENTQALLYPQPSASQLANTPQPVRFTNVDQVLIKARSGPEIPTAIRQITALLRDRPADGRRRPGPRHPPPVPGRGDGPVRAGGRRRHPGRPWHVFSGPADQALPHRNLAAGHHWGGGRLGVRRHRLRLLSGLEGLAARPDR